MSTDIHEIASGIYRISTFVPQVAAPAGFTFNQFLILGEEPALFHCGFRALFPSVAEAVKKVVPVERLRWITFGHFESDECGAMNQWLAAAPGSTVAHGALGCDVTVNDAADRPPRPLAEGEVIDLGGKRLRYLATPHVPHGWDAGLYFEETTGTLLCGDLLAHVGNGAALVESDIVAPAIMTESGFQATCVTATTAPTIRRLAKLAPSTLALMHGSSFRGDGAGALNHLADHFERVARQALAAA